MNLGAQHLYGLYWTVSSGLTNEELEFRNYVVGAVKEEKRDEARKSVDDILRRKIQAELESITTEDMHGNRRAAPRCALTQRPGLMRLWSVPDETPSGERSETESDERSETERELSSISDQILRLLLLYRAKRDFFLGRFEMPVTLAAFSSDAAICRMVEIATTDEQCLETTEELSSDGFIPAEHCPEAAEYVRKIYGK